MTNPALGAIIIKSFLEGHLSSDPRGCSLPEVFIPIPVILSSDYRRTFEGTNSRTGLVEWSLRNPGIILDISDRIKATKTITQNALIFSMQSRLVTVNNGLLCSRSTKIGSTKNKPESEIADYMRLSKRLGVWMGQTRSTATAFHTLGITI